MDAVVVQPKKITDWEESNAVLTAVGEFASKMPETAHVVALATAADAKAITARGLGVVFGRWANNPYRLMQVLASGLEDANFHTECLIVTDLIDEGKVPDVGEYAAFDRFTFNVVGKPISDWSDAVCAVEAVAVFAAKHSFTDSYVRETPLAVRKLEGMGIALSNWAEWHGYLVAEVIRTALVQVITPAFVDTKLLTGVPPLVEVMTRIVTEGAAL